MRGIHAHQLQLMVLDLNAHYTLANDVSFGTSFTDASNMWGSQGFVPVGQAGHAFNGRLEVPRSALGENVPPIAGVLLSDEPIK